MARISGLMNETFWMSTFYSWFPQYFTSSIYVKVCLQYFCKKKKVRTSLVVFLLSPHKSYPCHRASVIHSPLVSHLTLWWSWKHNELPSCGGCSQVITFLSPFLAPKGRNWLQRETTNFITQRAKQGRHSSPSPLSPFPLQYKTNILSPPHLRTNAAS